MATPVYLLITAGRTDLKMLVLPDDTDEWTPVDIGQNCRDVHQWMLDNPTQWEVAAPSDVELNGKRILDDNPKQRLPVGVSLKFTPDKCPPFEVMGGGLAVKGEKLLFIAPKVGAVVATLAKAAEYQLITFKGALVLYTHRFASHEKAQGEPIALGLALARWIAEIFGLTCEELSTTGNINLDCSTYFPFLTGDENQEGLSGEGLNQDAIKQLDKLMRTLSNQQANLTAYIAALGGLPEFKAYLHALAELHFQGRWKQAQNPEQAAEPFMPETHALHISDSGLVQARANALRLLRCWDIHGAAAALSHVPEQRLENWGTVVTAYDKLVSGRGIEETGCRDYEKALAQFFKNPLNWKEKSETTARQINESDNNVLFRFLLPGLRAESAARGGRWTEALNWTYTFYDAMLVDLIELLCRSQGNARFVKIKDRGICFIGDVPPIDKKLISNDDSYNWFKRKRTGNGINYDDGYASKHPHEAFLKIKTTLKDWQKWQIAYQGYSRYKGLRNDNTHKALNAKDVNNIPGKMLRAKLWEQLPGEEMTVIGTDLAKGCLATFRKENFDQEILALHLATLEALLQG